MLRLRPYKKCDAKQIVSWINDERIFRLWCIDRYKNYPISAEDMNEYYENTSFEDNFYPMTAFDETGAVGHLLMRFTDENKKILRFGFVIINPLARKKGYGQEMIRLALKYAFEILKTEKVTIGVVDSNLAAYNCYIKAGFTPVQNAEKLYYDFHGEDWCIEELECSGVK
ncbi:MAG: GNAT family protein [Clostridia bacterium]|nr:GNAT family protein [Clostridia bacterium]